MHECSAAGPAALRHAPAHRVFLAVGRRVQLVKGRRLQQAAIAPCALHVPLRVLGKIRDAHVDRRSRAEHRRVIRIRAGRHGLERRFVAAVPPRLIDLARRRRSAEARARQPERLEQPLAHEILPRLAARALEHRARDQVAAVAVDEVRARRFRGRPPEEPGDKFFPLLLRLALLLQRHSVEILRRIMLRTAAVREQLFQSDVAPRVVHLLDPVRKNLGDRRIPANLPVLHEHRRHARRHALCAGAEMPLVVERHRHHPPRVPHPGRADRDEFPLVHHRGGEPRNVVIVTDFFERGAHVVRIGMKACEHQTHCNAEDQAFHPQREKRVRRALQMISRLFAVHQRSGPLNVAFFAMVREVEALRFILCIRAAADEFVHDEVEDHRSHDRPHEPHSRGLELLDPERLSGRK